MLELYIANKNYSSWSLRPWVLMKVLGIPFVEKNEFLCWGKDPHSIQAFFTHGSSAGVGRRASIDLGFLGHR